MSKNPWFKRTTKKLGVEDIPSLVAGKHKSKSTHFYHKFDGTHVDVDLRDRWNITMTTRDGNDIAHLVPYIIDDIKNNPYWNMYEGVFACELVSLDEVMLNPKNVWGKTRTAIGVKEYSPELPKVQLVLYDVYEFEGNDVSELTYSERSSYCMPSSEANGQANIYCEYTQRIPFSEFVYLPRAYEIKELPVFWEHHIVDSKREGFVTFDMTPREVALKWEHTFNKVKPKIDVDCIVTGFILGKTGKNIGRVCTLQVAVYKEGKLFDIGKVSGMKEDEIIMWTERMNCEASLLSESSSYVIQAKATEVTVKGKLRFGSYDRERTDKRPDECLFEQLM